MITGFTIPICLMLFKLTQAASYSYAFEDQLDLRTPLEPVKYKLDMQQLNSKLEEIKRQRLDHNSLVSGALDEEADNDHFVDALETQPITNNERWILKAFISFLAGLFIARDRQSALS